MIGFRRSLLVVALACMSAGPTGAQQRPTRVEIWDLKLGSSVAGIGDDFTDYACGTNGGPRAQGVNWFAGFLRCRAGADRLPAVCFRYHDDLEYWAKANNFAT